MFGSRRKSSLTAPTHAGLVLVGAVGFAPKPPGSSMMRGGGASSELPGEISFDSWQPSFAYLAADGAPGDGSHFTR